MHNLRRRPHQPQNQELIPRKIAVNREKKVEKQESEKRNREVASLLHRLIVIEVPRKDPRGHLQALLVRQEHMK